MFRTATPNFQDGVGKAWGKGRKRKREETVDARPERRLGPDRAAGDGARHGRRDGRGRRGRCVTLRARSMHDDSAAMTARLTARPAVWVTSILERHARPGAGDGSRTEEPAGGREAGPQARCGVGGHHASEEPGLARRNFCAMGSDPPHAAGPVRARPCLQPMTPPPTRTLGRMTSSTSRAVGQPHLHHRPVRWRSHDARACPGRWKTPRRRRAAIDLPLITAQDRCGRPFGACRTEAITP